MSKLVFKFLFLKYSFASPVVSNEKKRSQKRNVVGNFLSLFQYSKHNLFITKYSDSIFSSSSGAYGCRYNNKVPF